MGDQTSRPTRIAIDFDDTLVRVDKDGEFLPFDGAKEAMSELVSRGFHIIIYSCRTGIAMRHGHLDDELELISATLRRFGIPFHEIFVGDKLVADLYVDDRSIPFRGDWDATTDEIFGNATRESPRRKIARFPRDK